MTENTETDSQAKPDFRQIDSSQALFDEFPAPIPSEFRVYIDPQAYARMKDHAVTTDQVELCGILVGRVHRDDHGPFLRINGVIEGEGANNYGAQVTFTHQTWTHINQAMDSQYPDQRIVGWYHTHPGFGVFLSNMDMFIQENFFSQPYQVAIVLETKTGLEGCFSWSEGRPEPLKRYWVGPEEVVLARGQASRFNGDFTPGRPSVPDKEGRPRPILETSSLTFRLMILLLLLLALAVGVLWGRMMDRDRLEGGLSRALEEELYSLVERTSLSAMAAHDFFDLRNMLKITGESLGQDNAAATAARLKQAEKLAAGLENHYHRRTIFFQQGLKSLLLKRGLSGYGNDPENLGHPSAELDEADLYLVRLAGLLGGFGQVNPLDLPEEKRETLKIFLEQILRLHPETKSRIKIMLPGLIEYYYSGQTPGTGVD